MKIIFSKSSYSNSNYSKNLGKKNINIYLSEKIITLEVNDLKLFLEGQFYYSIINGTYQRITQTNVISIVTMLVKTYGINNLTKHLEGSYLCCWVDQLKQQAGFFGDALNRAQAYYTFINEDITVSSKLKDVASRSKGLDQLSLYSYMLVGYPAVNDTFYSGVKRLGNDEYFLFSSKGVEKNKINFPKKIEKFSKKELSHYDELFTNSILSRASDNNIVMNSGGWDSTSIVSKLTESKPKSSISAAVWEVILPDGQSFNNYEVDKVKRIGDFFNIKTEIAKIDYSDTSLVGYWESHLDNLRDNHTYFWLHQLKVADMIGPNAKEGTRVFNGEASDSIHNFGFSQFVSVNYSNIQLREIADKAKSYLFSPSFFKSIYNNMFSEDKIMQFFTSYYGKEKFVNLEGLDNRNKNLAYFKSFMLSYPRVPFAKWQNHDISTKKLQQEFSQHIDNHYFNDIAEQCNPETLYYWLLQIYRRFHLNSYQISIPQVSMKCHNIHCVLPFLDSQIVDYMYRMPENWGRGLELRTTKYPLRYLSEHKWNMPLDILMEKGPHSYISENNSRWNYSGGNWDLYCEIMYKSVFAIYFKSVLGKAKLEDIFDPTLFKIDYLESVVKNYVNGKENPSDITILYRLATLVSIGFVN
jgi:hypothetical protein